MTSCAPTVRRSAVAIGSFVLLVLAVLLGTAAPASAHATLLFTGPAADATVADSPKSLVLVFDQPVSLRGTSVRLEPSARLGTATLSRADQAVTVPVRTILTEGVHTVDWQVTARDGDIMTGSYRFAVGPRTLALASARPPPPRTPPPPRSCAGCFSRPSPSYSASGQADASQLACPTRPPIAPVHGHCRARSWVRPPLLRWPGCNSGTDRSPP